LRSTLNSAIRADLPEWVSLRFGTLGVSFALRALCCAPLEDNVLSHSDPATGLPVGQRVARVNDNISSDDLLARVLASLEDDKAEEIVQIDLRGRSEMADYMVICSGRSTRQVAAIADKMMDRLKQDIGLLCKVEGKDTADWVLIDAGDVIVHVFRPEVRDFYQLEKMWMPGAAHQLAQD
jgi:ribosome-associated protein